MSTGYLHDNRGIGIRHHQLILPSVVCSTHVARRIANGLDAITFAHQHGCGIIGGDVAGIDDFFSQLAAHPNVSSVLVVGLGCETIQSQELGAKLLETNKSTRYQIIQESGGVQGTVDSGIAAAKQLDKDFPKSQVEIKNEQITVGIDNSNSKINTTELTSALKAADYKVEIVTDSHISIDNFSKLMELKAQVIISFPDENQPASGFPLIPVINIAGTGPLHQATIQDFDLANTNSSQEILDLLAKVIAGQETKAEKSSVGEIRAPRIVRSV